MADRRQRGSRPSCVAVTQHDDLIVTGCELCSENGCIISFGSAVREKRFLQIARCDLCELLCKFALRPVCIQRGRVRDRVYLVDPRFVYARLGMPDANRQYAAETIKILVSRVVPNILAFALHQSEWLLIISCNSREKKLLMFFYRTFQRGFLFLWIHRSIVRETREKKREKGKPFYSTSRCFVYFASTLLEQTSFILGAHHRLANQRDRRAAVRQERVVKLLPRSAASARCDPILPQPFDHQLAHRVVQIGGVKRASVCLLLGVTFVLQALLYEHLFRLLNGHSFSVQSDRGNESNVSQKSFLQLTEMQLRVALSKAGVVHHLLRVMGPTFRKCITDKDLPEL